MKDNVNTPYSAHQEVAMLLPWYANKTLQGKDLTCVESHLNVCLTCKIELEGLYKLSERVSDSNPFAPATATAYSKLHQRIKITNESELGNSVNVGTPTEHRPLPRQLPIKQLLSGRLTLALAATWVLAVVLIQPVNVDITSSPANQYRTLSSSKGLTTKSDDIRIIFSADIEPAQIDAILTLVQGRIISGPNQQGVFTIGFKGGRIGGNVFNERISLLRKDPNIIFVEPSLSSLQFENPNQSKL